MRKAAHALGFRFRLHRADLPGKPDLVLPKLRTVIFVHGCFWHMHTCPNGRVIPQTNTEFWQAKRSGNVARDRRTRGKLTRLGWRSVVIWECQTRDPTALTAKIARLLGPRKDE